MFQPRPLPDLPEWSAPRIVEWDTARGFGFCGPRGQAALSSPPGLRAEGPPTAEGRWRFLRGRDRWEGESLREIRRVTGKAGAPSVSALGRSALPSDRVDTGGVALARNCGLRPGCQVVAQEDQVECRLALDGGDRGWSPRPSLAVDPDSSPISLARTAAPRNGEGYLAVGPRFE
jgi:hypothetical protein